LEVIEERIEKRLASWKGKMLSFGRRLVLINSVLSSLPMFMLSLFLKSLEGFPRKLSTIDHGSSGNMINKKGSINLRNRPSFANQKSREV
jgi:hypothetical protein